MLKQLLSLPTSTPIVAVYIVSGFLPVEAQIDKKILSLFNNVTLLCATAADAKTTKLHVEHVQAQIKKNKNDTCVVQTHVDLKNIKWVE